MLKALKKVTSVLAKVSDVVGAAIDKLLGSEPEVIVVHPRPSRDEVRMGLIRNMDSSQPIKWAAFAAQLRAEEEAKRPVVPAGRPVCPEEVARWRENNRLQMEYFNKKYQNA